MTANRAAKPESGLLHGAFDIVVVLKGFNGLFELVCGGALFFIPAGLIAKWVDILIRAEIIEDPNDLVAGTLAHWAEGFGQATQHFAAVYLLVHGITKITLAILLFLEKRLAFPISIALFSALVLYALYRLSLSWSEALFAFIALDMITIAIIAREWKAVKAADALGA
ncbi:MAG: DUF2127 domain-containing protein [Alphaproteobacteria bacterium]|nr:DUF2127 domain-containing protein [Alphaproteobacteria bacterium]